MFNKAKNHEKIILHDIEKTVVREDIEQYVKHRLRSIFREQPQPDESDILRLVKKCDNLFVYAETALRFIGAKAVNNPQEQLAIILGSRQDRDARPYSALDSLYLQVLTKAIPQDDAIQTQVEKRNAKVIRAIVTLQEPLPVTALAAFVDMTPMVTQNALDSLQSVILVPSLPNAPPRIFHPSFTDFITSNERCKNSRFFVDVPTQEKFLGDRCLEIMIASLRQNIVGIEDWTMQNVDIDEGKVEKTISSELRYACYHWASHMTATEHADDKCVLLDQFTHGRLLNWMEAMSLLKEVPRAILVLRDAHAWAVSGYWLNYAVTDR